MTSLRTLVAVAATLVGTAGAANAQAYYFNPSATLYGQYPAIYQAPLVHPYTALSAPGAFGNYNYNYNFRYSYNYGYSNPGLGYGLPGYGYGYSNPGLYNAYNSAFLYNRAYQYGSFGNPYGYRFR